MAQEPYRATTDPEKARGRRETQTGQIESRDCEKEGLTRRNKTRNWRKQESQKDDTR